MSSLLRRLSLFPKRQVAWMSESRPSRPRPLYPGYIRRRGAGGTLSEGPQRSQKLNPDSRELKFNKRGFSNHFFFIIALALAIINIGPLVGFDVTKMNNRPQAASLEMEDREQRDEEEGKKQKKPKRPKRARPSLHDRQVIAYEDRIRAYSQPDKNFRLFATVRLVGDHVDAVMMTPQDFVRSILPGRIQPEGLGLEQYMKIDRKHYQQLLRAEARSRKDDFFGRVCRHGLLNFSDYLFLLIVLSTPRKNFEIAFRMLDMNGDGELQADEFDRVSNVLARDTAVGQRHRSVHASGKSRTALGSVFFGPDGKGTLTYQQFLRYVDELNREVLAMEFETYEPWNKRISELDVVDSLLTYATFMSDSKRAQLRKRVKHVFGSWSEGVTLEEFQQLAAFVATIGSAEWMFQFPPRPMTPEFLQEAAKITSDVELSEHVAKILFVMFCDVEDGVTKSFEAGTFFRVMANRQGRGLDRRGQHSISGVMSAMYSCGLGQVKDTIRSI